jgi:hypothetical protein
MGMGQTAIVVLLFLSLGLYVAGFRVIENDALTTFFNIDQTKAIGDQNPTLTTGARGALPTTAESSSDSASTGFNIVDGLKLVFGFVALIINMVTSPIAVLQSFGLPMEVVIMLCVPYMFLAVIGIVGFIRGVMSW